MMGPSRIHCSSGCTGARCNRSWNSNLKPELGIPQAWLVVTTFNTLSPTCNGLRRISLLIQAVAHTNRKGNTDTRKLSLFLGSRNLQS